MYKINPRLLGEFELSCDGVNAGLGEAAAVARARMPREAAA